MKNPKQRKNTESKATITKTGKHVVWILDDDDKSEGKIVIKTYCKFDLHFASQEKTTMA